MAKRTTQVDVFNSIVEAMQALETSDDAQTAMISEVIDKLVELINLIDTLSERQAMTLELLTKHIDTAHE